MDRPSWRYLVVASVVAAGLYLAVASGGHTVASLASLSFTDINPRSATHGQSLTLGQLCAKRGIALQFVASWCEVCREELPGLERLWSEDNAPIVFVAADEGGAVDSMLIVAERSKLTAPLLFVPEARLPQIERRFLYEILPATFFLDRGGRIRGRHEGAMSAARLASAMEATLGI
jgi:thiol-disulfide isomerase/thioredoxin